MFCSDRCRVAYNRESHLCCFYCGYLADNRDHITPHSFLSNSSKRKFRGKEILNACGECNKSAGAKGAIFLEDKIKFLIERYTIRYQLNVLIPEWSDEELAELGRSLKSAVKRKILNRQRAQEKVLFLKARYHEVIRYYADEYNDDDVQEE
jgi:hypothetical protein